jgi:hypothetical protein
MLTTSNVGHSISVHPKFGKVPGRPSQILMKFAPVVNKAFKGKYPKFQPSISSGSYVIPV